MATADVVDVVEPDVGLACWFGSGAAAWLGLLLLAGGICADSAVMSGIPALACARHVNILSISWALFLSTG